MSHFETAIHTLLSFLLDNGLENAGEDCWSGCNRIQGKCSWCGAKGYCCRKDWKTGNGCDGTFGGENGHQCFLKPGKRINKQKMALDQS